MLNTAVLPPSRMPAVSYPQSDEVPLPGPIGHQQVRIAPRVEQRQGGVRGRQQFPHQRQVAGEPIVVAEHHDPVGGRHRQHRVACRRIAARKLAVGECRLRAHPQVALRKGALGGEAQVVQVLLVVVVEPEGLLAPGAIDKQVGAAGRYRGARLVPQPVEKRLIAAERRLQRQRVDPVHQFKPVHAYRLGEAAQGELHDPGAAVVQPGGHPLPSRAQDEAVGEAVDRPGRIEPLRVQAPVAERLVVADVDDSAGRGLEVQQQIAADRALEVSDEIRAFRRRQGGEPRRGQDRRRPAAGQGVDLLEQAVGEAEVHFHLHQAGIVDVLLNAGAVQRHGAGIDDARWAEVPFRERRNVPRREHPAAEPGAARAQLARALPAGEAILANLPALGVTAQIAVLGVADVMGVVERIRALRRIDAHLPRGIGANQRRKLRNQRGQHRRYRAGGTGERAVDARGKGVATGYQQTADLVAVVEVAIVGAASRPGAHVPAVDVQRVAGVGGDQQCRPFRELSKRKAAAGEEGAVVRLWPRYGDPPRTAQCRP